MSTAVLATVLLGGTAAVALALWAIVRLARVHRTLRQIRDAGEDLRGRQEHLIAEVLQLEAEVLRLWQQLDKLRR